MHTFLLWQMTPGQFQWQFQLSSVLLSTGWIFVQITRIKFRIKFWYLVTRRGHLLMETGLLHDYFGNFSMWSERYYFLVEGSTWGEIEPMQGEIEMNLRNGRLGGGGDWSEHQKTWKLWSVEEVLDLHKSGNELSLDLHKSGNELSLDLHFNKSPKWNSSLLNFYKYRTWCASVVFALFSFKQAVWTTYLLSQTRCNVMFLI